MISSNITDLKNEIYLIMDNSMSKKDVGIFEKKDIRWENNIIFTLKSFEKFNIQVSESNSIFFNIFS